MSTTSQSKLRSRVCLCKACFPLQPYRSEMYRISLFCERSGRTNDMGTKKYPTFCYDTVGMENGLKPLRKSAYVTSEEQGLLCTNTCIVSKFTC